MPKISKNEETGDVTLDDGAQAELALILAKLMPPYHTTGVDVNRIQKYIDLFGGVKKKS